MRRRIAVLTALAGIGCGSQTTTAPPAPQSMIETISQFMTAVRVNDQTRMGALWGTERGPAVEWMKSEELKKRVAVIQKYLAHEGYRVVEGPLPVAGHDNQREFRIELQRTGCSLVQPLDLIRTHTGTWIVYDVHLEAATAPVRGCKPPGPGTDD